MNTPPNSHDQSGPIERVLRAGYERLIVPRIRNALVRQRIKMLWFWWGYWPLLFLRPLRLRQRLHLLRRFLAIDLNVLHAHLPAEIASIARELASRPAGANEVFVEAGCWNGGSSAKFSLLCRAFGYRLHVYDSFNGVQHLPPHEQAREWDFAGQYAAPEQTLRGNLQRFGEPALCEIHRGWFAETLAARPVEHPVRLAYIDCDLAKGTVEALSGIVPALAPDGVVFSQDFHIDPVREVLQQPETWLGLGQAPPHITRLGPYLARITRA